MLRMIVPRMDQRCTLCDAASVAVGSHGPRHLVLTVVATTSSVQLQLLESFVGAAAAVRLPVLVLVSTTDGAFSTELSAASRTIGGLGVVAALPRGVGVAERKWLAISVLLEAGFELLYADTDVVLSSGEPECPHPSYRGFH